MRTFSLTCLLYFTSAFLPSRPLNPFPPGTIVRMSTYTHVGHACPIAGTLWTARHVMQDDEQKEFVDATWSSTFGAGRAGTAGWDYGRDLAILHVEAVEGVIPPSLPLAEGPPSRGEKVYMVGYSLEDAKDPLAARVVEAIVTGTSAGYLWYDKSAEAGSSGSCVLNQKGQVVAIHTGGIERDFFGVGLWKGWTP